MGPVLEETRLQAVLWLTNLDRVLRAHPSVEAATDGW